jgi:hypothetical protein
MMEIFEVSNKEGEWRYVVQKSSEVAKDRTMHLAKQRRNRRNQLVQGSYEENEDW